MPRDLMVQVAGSAMTKLMDCYGAKEEDRDWQAIARYAKTLASIADELSPEDSA
jgi:hypothetical protein